MHYVHLDGQEKERERERCVERVANLVKGAGSMRAM